MHKPMHIKKVIRFIWRPSPYHAVNTWHLDYEKQNTERFIAQKFTVFKRVLTIAKSVTISFVMSIRPSVRMEQLGSNWTDFLQVWYLGLKRKFRKFKFH